MSINTDFYAETKQITWGGRPVCEVRGLTPSDIARVVGENQGDVEQAFSIMEGAGLGTALDPNDPESVAAVTEKKAQKAFANLVGSVPDLVAKVLAVACDSPDQSEFIRKNWVIPLQFAVLKEIARLTFVDSQGFATFLGNVMGLVNTFKSDQPVAVAKQPSPSPDGNG